MERGEARGEGGDDTVYGHVRGDVTTHVKEAPLASWDG